MPYLSQLSKSQVVWLCATLIAATGIVAVGWFVQPRSDVDQVPSLTTVMTIRQIAPLLDTTGKALAKELRLPGTSSMDTPLAELGVSQITLDGVAAHLWSHRGRQLKYFLFAAIVLWALVFLVRLGKPDGAAYSQRRSWYPRSVYVGTLVVAAIACGFVLSFVLYHPINPFNLFNFEFEGPPMVVMIVGSLVLGAVVYRPFCQFICPFGFVSWIVERVSLYRIRVSPTRCNGCGACGAACPTGAAKDIVAGRLFAADCYSCARCLTVCPHDAIRYCRRLEPAEAVTIE